MLLDETAVIRGCLSDDNENVALCQSAGELCTKCNEDFCNFQVGYSNIECITCSSEDNPWCGYHLPLNGFYQSKICAELVGRDNFCVSFSNGSNYYRGCLNEFEAVDVANCLNTDSCEICEKNFCNNRQLVNESCVECDSKNGNCKDLQILNEKEVVCKDVTHDRAGCYHYEKGEFKLLKFCQILFTV